MVLMCVSRLRNQHNQAPEDLVTTTAMRKAMNMDEPDATVPETCETVELETEHSTVNSPVESTSNVSKKRSRRQVVEDQNIGKESSKTTTSFRVESESSKTNTGLQDHRAKSGRRKNSKAICHSKDENGSSVRKDSGKSSRISEDQQPNVAGAPQLSLSKDTDSSQDKSQSLLRPVHNEAVINGINITPSVTSSSSTRDLPQPEAGNKAEARCAVTVTQSTSRPSPGHAGSVLKLQPVSSPGVRTRSAPKEVDQGRPSTPASARKTSRRSSLGAMASPSAQSPGLTKRNTKGETPLHVAAIKVNMCLIFYFNSSNFCIKHWTVIFKSIHSL